MATAGKILMFPVGNWTSGNDYGFLDIVYFGGSSYIAKTDIANSTVDPATDTTNWQILARGYLADTLSGIDGIDTSGLIGTAGATVSSQTLIDKIADMVADKLVLKTAISNQQVNDTTKVPSSALAYIMNQDIATLNSNLDNHVMLSGTNCEIVYNKAICILKIQAIGISLIGGNAINSNKFTLPTNVHLNFNIYEKLALLDSNWTPYSPANDCYVSSLSNGTINIRCSANVTNAVLVGSIILPRSAVSIT